MNYTNIIESIDPLYYTECEHKGKVERIDYATSYLGRPMDKYAFVYTPYGYDENQPYEILYLIHGGLEYAEKYLYEKGEENPLKRAVDHMIDRKEIPPVIIVTPSGYPDNKIPEKHDSAVVNEFHKELVNDLLPAVEGKYKTFNDRNHRSVMGWSMGSMTTWSIFMNRIANFSRFAFLSGHASVGDKPLGLDAHFDRQWANDTINQVIEAVKAQGFTKKDYSIYAITGTQDIVYEPFTLQMGVLQSCKEYFEFYGPEQNAAYLVWKDGEHHTPWRLQYTINAIKQVYR